jgi:hypothetical protein
MQAAFDSPVRNPNHYPASSSFPFLSCSHGAARTASCATAGFPLEPVTFAPIDKTTDLVAMTGRQKGNDGPERGRAPVSIASNSPPNIYSFLDLNFFSSFKQIAIRCSS